MRLGKNGSVRLGENAFVAEREAFLEVDAKDLEKKIKKIGADDGGVNSPRSDASQFSATEQETVKKVFQTALQTWNALQSHFAGFSTRLMPIVTAWEPEALINTIQAVPTRAKNQLTEILRTFKHESHLVISQRRNAKEEHENFRTRHKLTRDADYMASGKVIGWFISIMVVESVLNASLLWELTGGLTAFGQTALISAVNVIFFAAAVGLLLRSKNHSSHTTRWLAGLCAPVIVCVLVFNLGVGHFRDALVKAKARLVCLASPTPTAKV